MDVDGLKLYCPAPQHTICSDIFISGSGYCLLSGPAMHWFSCALKMETVNADLPDVYIIELPYFPESSELF
jgi:hypothetical protein